MAGESVYRGMWVEFDLTVPYPTWCSWKSAKLMDVLGWAALRSIPPAFFGYMVSNSLLAAIWAVLDARQEALWMKHLRILSRCVIALLGVLTIAIYYIGKNRSFNQSIAQYIAIGVYIALVAIMCFVYYKRNPGPYFAAGIKKVRETGEQDKIMKLASIFKVNRNKGIVKTFNQTKVKAEQDSLDLLRMCFDFLQGQGALHPAVEEKTRQFLNDPSLQEKRPTGPKAKTNKVYPENPGSEKGSEEGTMTRQTIQQRRMRVAALKRFDMMLLQVIVSTTHMLRSAMSISVVRKLAPELTGTSGMLPRVPRANRRNSEDIEKMLSEPN
ncbi:hypothetical protein BJ742DRAFT_911791 [Cladochytrium replicatum]|nr:hypothetical protein BJ742DRAFT_911791 [Cladochytrium replicatum]